MYYELDASLEPMCREAFKSRVIRGYERLSVDCPHFRFPEDNVEPDDELSGGGACSPGWSQKCPKDVPTMSMSSLFFLYSHWLLGSGT